MHPEDSNSEGVSSCYPSPTRPGFLSHREPNLLCGAYRVLLTQPQPCSSATLTRAQALPGTAVSVQNALPNIFHFANTGSSFSLILISLFQKPSLISTLNEQPLVHIFPLFPFLALIRILITYLSLGLFI